MNENFFGNMKPVEKFTVDFDVDEYHIAYLAIEIQIHEIKLTMLKYGETDKLKRQLDVFERIICKMRSAQRTYAGE